MKDWGTYRQDDKLLFQHYLLVFVDILGQRRSLREIKGFPNNDTEKEGFIKKLQETIGKVDALRGAFREFFETAESYTPDTSISFH